MKWNSGAICDKKRPFDNKAIDYLVSCGYNVLEFSPQKFFASGKFKYSDEGMPSI